MCDRVLAIETKRMSAGKGKPFLFFFVSPAQNTCRGGSQVTAGMREVHYKACGGGNRERGKILSVSC